MIVDRKCPVEQGDMTIPSSYAFNDHDLIQHSNLGVDIDSLSEGA